MRQLLLSLRAKLADMVVVRTTKRLPQLMPDCQLALACHQECYCSGPDAGLDASATFILGGQIGEHAPELYMIYPEGNHITASKSQPYLQIGETKYGKPILDRIIRSDTHYVTAMTCGIVSLDSTMRSNATVGPPLECLFYARDSLEPHCRYFKLDENHPYLAKMRESWDANVRMAFDQLPNLDQVFANE